MTDSDDYLPPFSQDQAPPGPAAQSSQPAEPTMSAAPAQPEAPPAVPQPAIQPQAATQQAQGQPRKTLIFANDKSSGKTTTANAVLVSLLERYPVLMRQITVREYERQPRLSTVFRREDGLAEVVHHNARNAKAFDSARDLAYDPNATPWDELLYQIGAGGLVVDLGSNIFADICRILDDEPRPVFPDGGEMIGVVVPLTTATDSVESARAAIDAVISWGPRTHVFVVEQEYLGRFDEISGDWPAYRDRLLQTEHSRVQVVRIEKLGVADIGRVVFQRIDRMVAEAQAMLQSNKLQGADYIRAIRQARSELGWGAKTLDAVRPIADWFAH